MYYLQIKTDGQIKQSFKWNFHKLYVQSFTDYLGKQTWPFKLTKKGFAPFQGISIWFCRYRENKYTNLNSQSLFGSQDLYFYRLKKSKSSMYLMFLDESTGKVNLDLE